MFRVCGREIQSIHYAVSYKENERVISQEDKTATIQTRTATAYCATLEEAKTYGDDIREVPPGADAWADGLIVPDVPDPHEAACKIVAMGEEAYRTQCKIESATTPEQLRADLDYVMAMEGL